VSRSTAQSPTNQRAAYIDWTRGIAVLLMLEAHTLDAWTRTASRGSAAYAYAVMAAGFAAPLFLWLAGLAVPLAAASSIRRGLTRSAAAEKICCRGLEIFILAFLFRLQAFLLSPGAHPVTLFRVDILNVLGPAIVMAGLVWLVAESTAVLVTAYAALAAASTMVTPLVRTAAFVSTLPTWVQWYLRPAADNTTFTGFPWIGFAFAGAAVGVLISAAGEPARRRLFVALAISGGALVALGFFTASLPSIYADSSFWTTSPTYFAIRVGAMTAALSLLYLVERMSPSGGFLSTALARLGRSSLFVYWIHVELVYGYASWSIHRRLPLWGTALAYVAFTGIIYGVVLLRDWMAEARRKRRSQIPFQYKAAAV
jgi:uncharacterized membrane protein